MISRPPGEVSFWLRQIGTPTPGAPLDGSVDVDVCVVGGGFTGLWTAYYLKLARPSLKVALAEQRFCGFGASGRNGGWLTAGIPGSPDLFEKEHGREAVVALAEASVAAVDEVIAVATKESIEADIVKPGALTIARNPAQLRRLDERLEATRRWEQDARRLSVSEVRERICIDGVLGGAHMPHVARVHPAKLVRGLAATVRRMGVDVYEQTRVLDISPGRVGTDRGTIRTRFAVRATEGFTAGLPGLRRAWLPMNSSMIVTRPLTEEAWRQIRWENAELLSDAAHAYFYAQRTPDGRIAIGGRGRPYRFGSRLDKNGETSARSVRALSQLVKNLFPEATSVEVDEAWSGVIAVPRDWCATVGLDRSTGLGWAGGYVGRGVAATNLAGRTMADLLLDDDTPRTHLPWVGRRSRSWEPEPLRWTAVHGLYAAYRAADRREQRSSSSSTAVLARVADMISRHP